LLLTPEGDGGRDPAAPEASQCDNGSFPLFAWSQGLPENFVKGKPPAFLELAQTLSNFLHQGAVTHDFSGLAPSLIFVRAQENSRGPPISGNDKLFLIFFTISHQLAKMGFGF
jgi:hypothetical protein